MSEPANSIFRNGAYILPNFIKPLEEERIIERISTAPWETELRHSTTPWETELRHPIQYYGYHYDHAQIGPPTPATPFSAWTTAIAERLRNHFTGILPQQCIVNEYRPGQGVDMQAHHPDFGPVVASLSLAAAWPMRFRHVTVQPYSPSGCAADEILVLPRRSVLVLTGNARTRWMHGIDPTDTSIEQNTRISATFSTLLI